MTSKKNTKKALISSILVILMCVTMLIGATFAWFTDTASTAVNKIQAGNLNIELQMKDNDGKWVNAEGKTLSFLINGKIPAEGTQILWEPGCTYTLPELRVINNGNLALKWKAQVNKGTTAANEGNFDLLDVIDFYLVTKAADGTETEVPLDEFSGNLKKTETSGVYYIKGVMQTTASNDYQGLTLNGITITVIATQDTVESDSFGNTYDKDAAYPVANAEELTAALQSEKVIVLANDITITTTVETAENLKQTLDFNGHKLILGGEDQFDYGCLDVYGELTLIDSVGNGGIKGEFYHNATKVPTAVFINDGAVVNLESGTIENVYRGVANYYTGGTFNMTGGKIAVKRASEIESAGVLFHRGGTVNLTGGEISGAVYFEKTSTSQPSYTIGAGFTNTNNSVFNTSGVTATQNEDGIWISTIR